MTESTNKIIILGLGNIGKEYEGSPHNAGFMVVDAVAKKLNAQFRPARGGTSNGASVSYENYAITLVKPTTFMNKSGTALHELLKNLELPHENIWVIHDDVDLVLGTIKIVQNRGAGGHKGVASIIDTLGANNFTRFRVGIRPARMPASRSMDIMNAFVVKPFGGKEKEEFADAIARCTEAIFVALDKGIARAMNEFN
ncbi:MAG: aminoacyl-tRNA hydrolase [Candidatus Spechtbacteria bacterium]|nr:aminoacyl-tRNA hydrolase [Candidatus Spechtbacteria bacterium]